MAPSSTPGAAPSSTARAVAPSSTSAPAFRSAPPAAFPFSRTAAALAAWQRNASEAARWAHPSWWAPALDVPPATASAAFDALRDALASTRAAALAACSRALLRAADVALPGFDSLRAPNPAVLDALPVEVGLRVLRMRALLLRRAEVRRLIDKQSRRRLAHWVGVPLERLAFAPGQGAAHAALGNEWTQAAPGNELARLLADMPADLSTKVSAKAPRHVPANAPDAARLVARGDLPPLDEIDDERLAYEGYALIARDMQEAAWSQKLAAAERQGARNGRSDDPHEAHHHKHASEPSHPHHHPSPAARPCPLLRLALPRDLPPPWPSASARELDVGGTALLFAQLPELLPEWAWLFG
ncbi:type III secretion protein [bacterium M00.F.Ca.ET.228.01.1.1]|uniref:type III secretion protein HrpB4 n=1 Tax=Paraburkholderia phenoliruptrix TaxID=252970 RepID=UPI001091CD39|nr:type III secretion protein HrpB4 [Paraburkholderia phenoliruptrix]TGP46316.1 type III secretion protein [bacterium M00.F.Ca.ET.228.01.1.1]TGS03770.1 type III secretion protein [bacterium M00.F.Ca.ET.191.01.1.1]TGU07610.1 type III secretion protein [bacterium M00.F.Ca.ET.155.01.1.1]MBW0446269.1 type III secretion protein [Paraburkholderia phenoliruptrix]MBW9096692.1 type III secretion protein [Paraburkholderia phenoliruptrix]